MRERCVKGLFQKTFDPAVAFAKEKATHSVNPSTAHKLMQSSLVAFHSKYVDFNAYVTKARANSPGPGGMTPEEATALPKWCVVTLQGLLRSLYEGRKDIVFHKLLATPPRGGLSALSWDVLEKSLDVDMKSLNDQISEWKASFDEKPAENEGKQETPAFDPDADGAADEGTGALDDTTSELLALRAEVTFAANTERRHYVNVLPCCTTEQEAKATIAAACAGATIASSGGKQRICFLYAVPLSWDPRAASFNRPRSLWWEDFPLFARTIDNFIDAENENYAVVLLGNTKLKNSSHLLSQSGIHVELKIMQCLKEIHVANRKQEALAGAPCPAKKWWRMKKMLLTKRADDLGAEKKKANKMKSKRARQRPARRGIFSKVSSEHVLFFFRGSWPQKLPVRSREENQLSGTTQDDNWGCGPAETTGPPVFPEELRTSIFQPVWNLITQRQQAEKAERELAGEPPSEESAAEEGADKEEKENKKRKAETEKEKGAEQKEEAGQGESQSESESEGEREETGQSERVLLPRRQPRRQRQSWGPA